MANLVDGADANASPTTPLIPSESSPMLQMRHVHWFLAPFLDEQGSPAAVVTGVLTLGAVGTLIGLVTPKSPHLNGVIYPYVSSSLGYTYFLMWSVSFYPQVVTNFKRRTTSGLSPDFCLLNVIGFACYSIYNLSLYCDKDIRRLYKERHGGDEVPVASNDVAFALHAFILASITLLQILYYDGIQIRLSKLIGGFIVSITFIIGLYPVAMVLTGFGDALDFIYLLSYIKMAITVIKYTPQVILNYHRRSTSGWSIWQIVLDFGGGCLSDAQLILDCWNLHHWSGITGNLAKLALGMVSILFDIVFLIQHYVLYGNNPDVEEGTAEEENTPMLPVTYEDIAQDAALTCCGNPEPAEVDGNQPEHG